MRDFSSIIISSLLNFISTILSVTSTVSEASSLNNMKYSSRILPVVLALSATLSSVDAFTSLSSRSSHGAGLQQVNSRFMGRVTTFKRRDQNVQSQNHRKGTELGMFLGNDGGILGVGAPEVVRIHDLFPKQHEFTYQQHGSDLTHLKRNTCRQPFYLLDILYLGQLNCLSSPKKLENLFKTFAHLERKQQNHLNQLWKIN